MMRFLAVFWWLEGVGISSFFFLMVANTRSWIAHISHIHDVQRMPSPCTAEIGKDTQADVCVRVQMAVHTNDMVSIYTHTHYI